MPRRAQRRNPAPNLVPRREAFVGGHSGYFANNPYPYDDREFSKIDFGKDWYAIQWNLRKPWEKNKNVSPDKNGQITTERLGHSMSKLMMNLRQAREKNKKDLPDMKGLITAEYHMKRYEIGNSLMKFTYTAASNVLNLTVTEIDHERPLQCVTAIMNGQIQERTSTSGNEWGPFIFTHSISEAKCLDCSKNCTTYPIFHLRLTFKRPSNARIRQILNYLRCLRYDDSADDEGVIKTFGISKSNLFPADVQITVGDKKIWAHSAIVAAASPLLAALLESKQYETVHVEDAEKSKLIDHVKVIRVDDVDCDALRQLLSYMYTGEIEILFDDDGSMTKNALSIAIKFQMEALKQLLLTAMEYYTNDENVIDCLILGHVHSAPSLFEKAVEHITYIRRKICETLEWKQLCQLYPDLYFDLLRRVVGDGPAVKRARSY